MRYLTYIILFIFLIPVDAQVYKAGGKIQRSTGKVVKVTPYIPPTPPSYDTTQFDDMVDKTLFGPLFWDETYPAVGWLPEDTLAKYVVAAGAMHLDSIERRSNGWNQSEATTAEEPNIASVDVPLRSGGTLATKFMRFSQPAETTGGIHYTPMNWWFKYATTSLYPADELYDQWHHFLFIIEDNAGNNSMEGTDEMKMGKISMSVNINTQVPSSDTSNYAVNNIGVLLKGNTPADDKFRGTSYATGGFFCGYPGGQLTHYQDTTSVWNFDQSDTVHVASYRVITRRGGTGDYGAIQFFWDGWLGWTWINYPDDYEDCHDPPQTDKQGDPLPIAIVDSVSNTVKFQYWWGGSGPDDMPHNGPGTLHVTGHIVNTLDESIPQSRWCELWPRHVRIVLPDSYYTILGE